jgi:hypothetical protein
MPSLRAVPVAVVGVALACFIYFWSHAGEPHAVCGTCDSVGEKLRCSGRVVTRPQPASPAELPSSVRYLVTPPKKCIIIVERHLHKNGGSTSRDVLLENERRGGWMYWGYSLGRMAPVFDELRRLAGSSNDTLRLAIEYHHGFIEFNPTTIEYVGGLRASLHLHHRVCPIILVTRLRAPTAFYVSYFRWAVAWRQRQNPGKFGNNFTDWAPPNLQSALLLRSMDHMWAENVGLHHRQRKVFRDFDSTSMRRLQDMLLHFDLVGTTERFDETLLLLADMTGLQYIRYWVNNPTERSHWKREVTREDACPDLAMCNGHVHAIAPFDTELYENVAERFDKLVIEQGSSFQHRLQLFRVALGQRSSNVRTANRCRYYPINPRRFNASRYACPLAPEQAHLCDAVHANREIRCPWNYVANRRRHTRGQSR